MDGQEIFDAITDSAVLLDKAGRIINWNSGAASLFGYVKREVLGRSINFIFDRNYPFPKLTQEIVSDQKKWYEDTTYIRKNGIKGNCRTFLCPLPPNEQNKVTALMLHQNMTDFKKIEHERVTERMQLINHLQTAIKGLYSNTALLNTALNQLEQAE